VSLVAFGYSRRVTDYIKPHCGMESFAS
jgi:hypothetical protein